MSHTPFAPSLIVDTTGHFEAKRAAIECYGSQLHRPGRGGRPTRIAKPSLLADIECRDRYFGGLIERTYGEPFVVKPSLPMDDPVSHFLPFPLT
jgi:LmbE family N-acetylglucosaminyl deacetylase